MSMPNLIWININIMDDEKGRMLICFFISMLVGHERGHVYKMHLNSSLGMVVSLNQREGTGYLVQNWLPEEKL
jgi:hypothetical protein